MTDSSSTRVVGVIPARLASTRLPRKVLREIAGQPLLAWVYAAALRCPQLDEVVIAADSPEVEALCCARRWPCVMTSPDLPSGTDRLHAVSHQIPAAIYVNIQGDEPLLHPSHIEDILRPFENSLHSPATPHSTAAPHSPAVQHSTAASHIDVTTLKVPCTPENITNPNAVKVVTAADGRALYFSRSPIPFDRDAANAGISPTAPYWKHLGLYAYRRAALQRFATLAPGVLEQTERLEQLRFLENNIALYVAETTHDTIGVDTEEDLLRVESILLSK